MITRHIVRMLAEAQRLAMEATAAEHDQALAMLGRAANLAEHAAAELRSEVLEAQGWPPV